MPDAESGRDAGDDAHDVRVTNDVRDNTLSDACNAGSTHDACGDPACEDGTCTCVESDQAFCQRLGKDCDTVFARDACGLERTVDCGSCSAPEQCGGGGSENECGCPLESDTIFCARIGAPCGNVTATDSCNAERTTYCGTCGAGEMCVDNTCVCERETDAVFCERVLGCGELTALDNCGDFRTIDCQRACPGDEYCVDGQCTCEPERTADFCARHGAMCGGVDAPDNCGVVRTEDCGTCPASDNVCWENRCNAFPANGLVLNLAAAVGVTESSGSRVSRWTDQVSGRSFTGRADEQPVRVVGHGGHRALRFSGDELLTANNPLSLNQSYTISLVIERRPTSQRGAILSGDSFGSREYAFGTTPDTIRIGGATAKPRRSRSCRRIGSTW